MLDGARWRSAAFFRSWLTGRGLTFLRVTRGLFTDPAWLSRTSDALRRTHMAGQHPVRDANEADDQKMLSGAERRRSVQAEEVENVISAMNWVWGGLVGLCVCALPLVLILIAHLVDDDNRTTHEQILWLSVFLPCFIIFAIQLAIANLMAPKIGFDMIQERSPTVSMREAMRSNLTNLALVSALFLTIVYAMFQADAAGVSSYSMLSQCTCLTAPGHTPSCICVPSALSLIHI